MKEKLAAIWAWVKKNPWRAIALPLSVACVVLAWLYHGGNKNLPQMISGTTDEAAAKALAAKEAAMQAYQASLKALEQAAQSKLNKASAEQIKEYESLKDKPPAEVAAWIDKLS